jgi:3-hydroxyisobutyrate dehydrogenase-like beta-hydroxyacid dehydrogenase
VNVAVAGLGRMGEPIARRLLGAGHELTVWNRTPERGSGLVAQGARMVATPADVWEDAAVVVTMLSDDHALEAVSLGPGGLLTRNVPADAALIDMSTVSTGVSGRIAEAAGEAGVDYLRAPVSGNPTVVEAGNLTIVVSGDEEAFSRHEPLLRDIGPNVFYLGPGEQARVLKLAVNLVLGGTAQLLAEALVLGEAHGLDRARMLEIMGGSAIGSPFVKYKTAALVADDYTTTFPSTMLYKDLGLALAAGHDEGVPLPVTACVQQLVQGCIASGWADDDLMALLPRLRREAGRPDA